MKYGTDEVIIVNNIWIVSKYLSNIITIVTCDSQPVLLNIIFRFYA